MSSPFIASKTLLACGLLAAAFALPLSAQAGDAKAGVENPKIKVQEDAIAKVDEVALKEVEKVKAECDKKLAEARKKAAVARIAVRNKAVEELTRDKKRAILAEKLDEAAVFKTRIDIWQNESDAILTEGSKAIIDKEAAGVKMEGETKAAKVASNLIVGKWVRGDLGHVLVFSADGRVIEMVGQEKGHDGGTWEASREGDLIWRVNEYQVKIRLHGKDSADAEFISEAAKGKRFVLNKSK